MEVYILIFETEILFIRNFNWSIKLDDSKNEIVLESIHRSFSRSVFKYQLLPSFKYINVNLCIMCVKYSCIIFKY